MGNYKSSATNRGYQEERVHIQPIYTTHRAPDTHAYGVCPNCKAPLTADTVFCGTCGFNGSGGFVKGNGTLVADDFTGILPINRSLAATIFSLDFS